MRKKRKKMKTSYLLTLLFLIFISLILICIRETCKLSEIKADTTQKLDTLIPLSEESVETRTKVISKQKQYNEAARYLKNISADEIDSEYLF